MTLVAEHVFKGHAIEDSGAFGELVAQHHKVEVFGEHQTHYVLTSEQTDDKGVVTGLLVQLHKVD